jgi:hypothetical protein
MPYSLIQLASGSYDIALNSNIIGAVVRGGTKISPIWIAELLYAWPPEKRPMPFKEVEHEFASFQELRLWLGNPPVSPSADFNPTE